MRGLRLDPLTHDLVVGSLTIDGEEATDQEIKTRLLFFKAESFTDRNEGVPWYQEILVKGGDLGRVRAIVRATIASVPAVVDVPVVDLTLDAETRELSIYFEARSKDGAIIRSSDYPPLVVPSGAASRSASGA